VEEEDSSLPCLSCFLEQNPNDFSHPNCEGNIGSWMIRSLLRWDDVLAVSPADAALNATLKVRIEYGGEPYMGFLKQSETEKDTFVPSLGYLGQPFSVTYAHYRYPLSHVLKVGVNALEEEAKDVEWLESDAQSSKKDSVIVTYMPRGGSQIQARLSFRAKDDQIGELVRRIIKALEIIDKGLISASLVKDLDEWMGKIWAAYSASGTELAKKIIDHVVDKNASSRNPCGSTIMPLTTCRVYRSMICQTQQ